MGRNLAWKKILKLKWEWGKGEEKGSDADFYSGIKQ